MHVQSLIINKRQYTTSVLSRVERRSFFFLDTSTSSFKRNMIGLRVPLTSARHKRTGIVYAYVREAVMTCDRKFESDFPSDVQRSLRVTLVRVARVRVFDSIVCLSPKLKTTHTFNQDTNRIHSLRYRSPNRISAPPVQRPLHMAQNSQRNQDNYKKQDSMLWL